MNPSAPITVTPDDIQKDIDPTFLGGSCNSQYLVYRSPTVSSQIDIFGSGLPTTENRRPVNTEPDWCSISSNGRDIIYGQRDTGKRPSGYVDNLESGESLRIPGIVIGLFVGDSLWTLRLVRKQFRMEVRKGPNWKVCHSLDIDNFSIDLFSDFDLLHIYRPNSVLLRLNTFESIIIELDSAGQLVETSLVGLLGLNCSYHIAPHGGEITAVQEVGVYRLIDPFKEIHSHVSLPTYGGNGCYLDDVHFLGMGPQGVLYLIHTRSSSVVAHFTIEKNVRHRLLSAQRFSTDQVVLTLAGTQFAHKAQRYLFSTEEFLGRL